MLTNEMERFGSRALKFQSHTNGVECNIYSYKPFKILFMTTKLYRVIQNKKNYLESVGNIHLNVYQFDSSKLGGSIANPESSLILFQSNFMLLN